ncbi:BNR-4 repeat-containing protein [Polaribacter sp. L3A8]|uniref:BNR-4 repeat-containing protein n=1 Tax=Polaribacter sp. L3A8 TaxID=2686361 RepID=UPI001E62CDC8|nr:BNR-4 repeat-containing protein [Polaribacter sp. L3A8]
MTLFLFLGFNSSINAQVILEKEVKISDIALHFDGVKVGDGATNTGVNAPFDYFYGRNISAHGDCIKTYGKYVFMTWYRGGKADRHVMLTRYNTETGTMATIEFPHTHTGFNNQWWIGESHNTIGIGISPIDGTIHLLYDMHAYHRTRPSDGSLAKDYFRYSYSKKNIVSVSDAEFTLSQFEQNNEGGYKHLSLNGGEDYSNFQGLTYPQFFVNDSGDLFMYMREGGNNNGAYKFSKYTASTSTWSSFTHFNVLNAKNKGGDVNWGLYGNMKYINGKIRVGFQRRANKDDKYQYQNGVYYAYSDNQSGADSWKNHKGTEFNLPLIDADFAKVMEPGDYVQTTQKDKVYIVQGFDWTVTDKGDVHIISQVKDNEFNVTKYLHTYKPAGANDSDEFTTSEDFAGGSSIYTFGDDVYIIGLTGGRVYVEKAKGGTNNFTRVYQATSGKVFDHGRVHIADGKLYYYLMERKTGNAQPIYLQIIDLGILPKPFNVSLAAPYDNQVFNTTETIQLRANSSTNSGTISKVEFWVDGQLYSEDTTSPYTGEWSTQTPGTHTVKAIAYNDKNESLSSTEVTITVNVKDFNDLSGDIYRIKNVATGRYLDSEESAVITSEVATGEDKEWKFVKSGDFYNIDSSVKGILRFAGGSAGTIINTGFAPPRADVDKIWTVIYEGNGVYTFETKNSGRYLYNEEDNTVSHSLNKDDRSKWIVESTTAILSVNDNQLILPSINVYPNPVKDQFTISLKGITNAKIFISDMLGKIVYKTVTNKENVLVTEKLNSGIYIIRVISDHNKVYNHKIIVK